MPLPKGESRENKGLQQQTNIYQRAIPLGGHLKHLPQVNVREEDQQPIKGYYRTKQFKLRTSKHPLSDLRLQFLRFFTTKVASAFNERYHPQQSVPGKGVVVPSRYNYRPLGSKVVTFKMCSKVLSSKDKTSAPLVPLASRCTTQRSKASVF